MKNIIKSMLTMLAVAMTMVACEDAQPEFDNTLLNDEVAARETLATAEAGYSTDGKEGSLYKMTLTLLSEGVTINNEFNAEQHCESFAGYGGTGYAFELELNSESKNALASGVYMADTISKAFTYNPENSYLTVVHNGNSTKQVLGLDTKISISASDGIYTVTIDGKNAINVPVKGTYEGAIKFYNLKYYREPETAKTINIEVEDVAYVKESGDKQGSFDFITITGSNGEIVSLRLKGNRKWFKTGKFQLEEGLYNTEQVYREDRNTIYSFLSMNGEIYYLSGSIDVETYDSEEQVKPLKSFKLKSKSAYGTKLNIEYTMPVEEQPVEPVEPETPVTTAKVWGIVTAGEPLAGATVTVTSTDSTATYSATSAADGKYSIIVEDLTKTYKLVVSADGYESWTYADPSNGFSEEFTLSAGQELAVTANLNAISTLIPVMGMVIDEDGNEISSESLEVSIFNASDDSEALDILPIMEGMIELEADPGTYYIVISDIDGVYAEYQSENFTISEEDEMYDLGEITLTKVVKE